MSDDDTRLLLESVFKVVHPFLHTSSPTLRNRVLWTYCSIDEEESNASPFVFVLLRMAMLWLEVLPPYSDEVLLCVRALSVIVECLLLTAKERGRGMRARSSATSGDVLGNSTRSSPSTSFDHQSGSSSGGSVSTPLKGLKNSKRSPLVLPSMDNEEQQMPSPPTAVPQRSFAVELEEEEQWAIVLTNMLHRQLIQIRDQVFGQQ